MLDKNVELKGFEPLIFYMQNKSYTIKATIPINNKKTQLKIVL